MERPQRQYTRLNMTLSQILPKLLKTNLVTLREAPKNPITTSPLYNPNSHCAYHSDSPGHDTNNCWALKNKVEDLTEALHQVLEAKLVMLKDPPQNPNTASPRYNPNARCVYHSNSPGHDTNSCWALKNKIQDLIDEEVLEFAQDGQLEFFCHSSKTHHLK